MNKLNHVETFSIPDDEHITIWSFGEDYIILDGSIYEPLYSKSVREIFDLYLVRKGWTVEGTIHEGIAWRGIDEYTNIIFKDLDSFYCYERGYKPSKYNLTEDYDKWPDYIRKFHKEWNEIVWEEVMRVKNKIELYK